MGHAHDHHDHGHHHGHGLDDRRRLYIAIALTFTIFVAEVVGGLASGSLALLSDAGHMMTDVSAQLISLFALMLAERPADHRRSYGYRRLEILAALANGVLLAALATFTLYSAARRFDAPPAVDTGVLLPVAAIGLVANLAAALLLRPSQSLNVRGAYLHIVSDALSSAAVIVGGAIMWWQGGLYVIDPILSCAISLFVLASAWRLGREAVDVLLEAVPRGVDLEQVRRDLAAVEGVAEVHDLHIWTLGGGLVALSAHVVVAPGVFPGGYDPVLRALDALARDRHGIRHSTIQIESQQHDCAPQAH